MVRGRVHGVVVVCEVRVGAGLVVRGRVDRAVPCAPPRRSRWPSRSSSRPRPLRSPPRGSRRRGPGPGTPRSASSSLNPRARTSSRRTRGLPDELVDPAEPGRLGRDDWGGDWGRARDGPGAGRPPRAWSAATPPKREKRTRHKGSSKSPMVDPAGLEPTTAAV